MSLEKTFQTYKDRADFYLIYLKEAHASDGNRPARHVDITQHTTLDERTKAANSCVADLKLSMPLLVDNMKNTVGDAFQGHPDRLFILTPEGKIAFRGERGPRGFKVDEMRSALETLLTPAAKQE
ncbi:MAG: hypothetical protein O3A87_04175 [Verrucomicrobia bacterium]|nr:hypothetical protein [Verrucomicrobiota bacterium]